jgi:hypothetical protein
MLALALALLSLTRGHMYALHTRIYKHILIYTHIYIHTQQPLFLDQEAGEIESGMDIIEVVREHIL